MNAQDFRSLQEAYMEVYNELDEAAKRTAPKIPGAKDVKSYQDGRSPAGMMVSGNSQVSGAGFMRRGGGVQTQTNPNARQPQQGRMDRDTRADMEYRKTLLKSKGGGSTAQGAGSPSGTRGYHVGAGQGYGISGIKLADEYDFYDIILSHLLDEGYAETPEAAEAIMVNMSEEWRESILG